MTSRDQREHQAFGRQADNHGGSRQSALSDSTQWPPGLFERSARRARYDEDVQGELDGFEDDLDMWSLDREEYLSDRKNWEE